MPPLPFPDYIDSSMRAEYVACPTKFLYRYIHGFTRAQSNVHLFFGGCFAKGLETFRRTYWSETSDRPHNTEFAVARGVQAIIKAWGDYEVEIDTPKTLYACIDALASYVEQYPPDTGLFIPHLVGGEPTVEVTFAVPIPGLRHPQSGKPLPYVGRYDMLACRRDSPSRLYIEDDKTASALGASWIEQWKMRGQFTGYAWAAREHDIHIDGIIIRGVGILKTMITHAEALQTRSTWFIDRWLTQLTRDVERMMSDWEGGTWDQAFDVACSQFGGCQFIDLCSSPDPSRWFSKYRVEHWNPLSKGDE